MRRPSYAIPLLLILFLSGWATTYAQKPIDEIPVVRKLTANKAAQGLPVAVGGQVLWIHQTGNGFFLHDREKKQGIYVHRPGAPDSLARLSRGDLVNVFGKTDEGFFSPSIYAERIETVGTMELPEARPFHTFELYSAQIDCDWVWAAGRIISKRVQNRGQFNASITLDVIMNSVPLVVQVPLVEGAEEKVDALMFQRVKFNAVAGTQFNTHRQVVGRTFYVESPDDFEVIDDYKHPKGVTVKPIHKLMRAGSPHHRMATATKGIVTSVRGSHLFLRGERASIKVTVRGEPKVHVGDLVEVEGVVIPNEVSPEFAAFEVRLLERLPEAPKPVKLELDDELRAVWDNQPESSLNHDLVQLDAELVDISESFGLTTGHREKTLVCRQGAYLFETKVPHYVQLDDALKPGAILRVQGICNLTRSAERRWRLYVDWFWIQVRSGADIEILEPTPWWTAARLLWVLALGLGLLVLISVWVFLLRRTVAKQTGIIADQVERETISDERQRIARELHDNLEQGLAGMAIQLRGAQRILEINQEKRLASIHGLLKYLGDKDDNIKKHLEHSAEEVAADAEKNRHAIEVVQGMLAHCSQESRTSIMDLRGGILERLDLVEALRETLKPLAQACGAEFVLTVEGRVRKFKKEADRNLLLIVKEAVANASKHAEPDEIEVVLNYTDSGVIFRIIDDGAGFDSSSVPKSGHFGLQGMQERVNQLKGTVKIESRPGEGTCVSIHISSMAEWELV